MVSVNFLQNVNVLNLKNVKRVFKDGSIQFRKQKYAVEYMRNRCSASVREHNPFERGIGINGCRVVGEANGTSTRCNLSVCTEISGHSHPDTYAKGCTTAPSADDYFVDIFGDKKCRKMFVFNSKGEYYSLEKIPGFDFTEEKVSELYQSMTSFIIENTPSEQKNLLYIIESLKPNEIPKFYVDATHKFWVKYGKMFGVKVETNFSNFANVPVK